MDQNPPSETKTFLDQAVASNLESTSLRAADEIRRLQSRVRELEAALAAKEPQNPPATDGWQRVERHPKNSSFDVFIWLPTKETVTIGRRVWNERIGYYWEYDNATALTIKQNQPTHWMPIPKGPAAN